MQQQIWDAYAITTSTCENRTWKNMIFGHAQTTTIKVKKKFRSHEKNAMNVGDLSQI